MFFRYLLQSRWGDMDAMHHVNNVRYVEYAQEARIAFLARGVRLDPRHRKPFVVVRQEIDYHLALVHTDAHVAVDVVVARIGTRSVTLTQTVCDPGDGPGAPGQTYAEVLTVLAGFDPATQASRVLDDDERAGLSIYLRDTHDPT